MAEAQPEQKTIYVPSPEGHRRAALTTVMGQQLTIDDEPEVVAGQLLAFLDGDERLLELRDAQYGEPIWLTRRGAGEVLHVCVAWVKNPAPQTGRGRDVVVARDLPTRPLRRRMN